MKFKDYILDVREEKSILESFLDEMANLPSADTGLHYTVWIGEVGGQHGPRIKVSNTKGKMNKDDCFVVSVEKQPRLITPKSCKLNSTELDDVYDWIVLNYDTLIKLWKVYETGTGSATKLISLLNKI